MIGRLGREGNGVQAPPVLAAPSRRLGTMHGGKDRHPFPVPVAVYDEMSGCSNRR